MSRISNALKYASQTTLGLRYGLDALLYGRKYQRGELEKLKDAARGQAVLVVGNGPSLNRTPLDEFSGVRSIGMNKIDLLYKRVDWRPDFVCCINNLVARQHAPEMLSANKNVFFSWKNRMFMDRGSRERSCFFVERSGRPFSTDPTDYIATGPTVTYTALQFAYWMGADPVIIFGCDHSFKFDGDPLTYEKMKGDDPNHFDPNYFKGHDWGTPDYIAMEACYAEARHAFEKDGRKVFDATIDGKLQIFEKISVDEAKSLCGLA